MRYRYSNSQPCHANAHDPESPGTAGGDPGRPQWSAGGTLAIGPERGCETIAWSIAPSIIVGLTLRAFMNERYLLADNTIQIRRLTTGDVVFLSPGAEEKVHVYSTHATLLNDSCVLIPRGVPYGEEKRRILFPAKQCSHTTINTAILPRDIQSTSIMSEHQPTNPGIAHDNGEPIIIAGSGEPDAKSTTDDNSVRIERLRAATAAARAGKEGAESMEEAHHHREEEALLERHQRTGQVLDLVATMTRSNPAVRLVDINKECRARGFSTDEACVAIGDALDLGLTHREDHDTLPDTASALEGSAGALLDVQVKDIAAATAISPPSPATPLDAGSRSGLTDILPTLLLGQERTRNWVDTVTVPAKDKTGNNNRSTRESSPDFFPGPPSLASTPKRDGHARENHGDQSEEELLRGTTTGEADLGPDTVPPNNSGNNSGAADRRGNTTARTDNNNNNHSKDKDNVNPFSGPPAPEVGSDLSSVFSSPRTGASMTSTPRGRGQNASRNRTKSNWDDTDEEPEDGRDRSEMGRGPSKDPRKRRRASEAQRQRRARERHQQAVREAELEDQRRAMAAEQGGQPQPHSEDQRRHQEQQQQRDVQGQPAAGHPQPGQQQMMQQQHQQQIPAAAGTNEGVLQIWGAPPPPPPPQRQSRQSAQAETTDRDGDVEMPPVLALMGPPGPPQTGVVPQQTHPSTSQGLAPEFVKAISDDVNRCCAGGNGEFFDPDETGIFTLEHEFDYDDDDAMDTTVDLDTTQVFNVRDLVSSGMEVTEGAQVRTRDVVPYVLLKLDEATDNKWSVPDTQLFHGLTNRLESRIMRDDLPCGAVLKWSNLWGKVGLLGLSVKNAALLSDFRNLVESQVKGSIRFSIYPRDALEKKGNVSVLLRETYRDFDIGVLAKTILRRTRKLKGGLRVTHVKEYGDKERSRAGASKAGWRLVLLQGTPDFMASLEQFEADHRFWVGSDRVIIRGGNRKPSSNNNNNPGQGGRPRGSRSQQQHRSDGDRTRNKSYDHNYPAAPGRHNESSRGPPRREGLGSAGGSRAPSAWGEAPPRRGGPSH